MKEKILKYDFWFFNSIETMLLGLSLVWLDYIYDGHMPFMFNTFSPPFFGIIMIGVGLLTLISVLQKINIITVILLAINWSYVFMTTIIDITNSRFTLDALTVMLAIVSCITCIRILFNAYYNLSLGKNDRG
ncbi:hypothetical protein P078_001 [Lactococcus phage P078]|uniref:Uncharacterized protein n=1 Tax=Lactococcus phage P078 TaxID=1476886 RepID=X4YW68_9CAUD|nr:hypothetical protein GJ21_gp01 [Lactococcus phage P078]AHV82964.1 hypothetical protein P078_001 [Lactococcus phage P078]